MVKCLPAMQETWVPSLGREDPLEKGMAYAVAAAKLLQSCPTLHNPIDGSLQASLSLGFSRQEWLPIQYSCLENSMDRGAWQAMVHGVAKSGTQLKRIRTSAHFERFSLLPSSGRILSFLY